MLKGLGCFVVEFGIADVEDALGFFIALDGEMDDVAEVPDFGESAAAVTEPREFDFDAGYIDGGDLVSFWLDAVDAFFGGSLVGSW